MAPEGFGWVALGVLQLLVWSPRKILGDFSKMDDQSTAGDGENPER
jgi:hypothetical protein